MTQQHLAAFILANAAIVAAYLVLLASSRYHAAQARLVYIDKLTAQRAAQARHATTNTPTTNTIDEKV